MFVFPNVPNVREFIQTSSSESVIPRPRDIQQDSTQSSVDMLSFSLPEIKTPSDTR